MPPRDNRGGGRSGRRPQRPARDDARSRPRPGDRSGRPQDRPREREAEAGLSREARERLDALRADFAADPDRDTPEGDRDTHSDVPGGVRLQKVLAAAGVGSRRYCEELIADGRVEVNGQVVRRFGARVDPATSEIRVDGQRVVTASDLVYFALNKPRKVVSTMHDPEGRRSLADLVDRPERLFHVGRLDYDTEGLILLTNDGELAHRLAHPSYEVLKTYLADVPGPVTRKTEHRLRDGVELEDGLVRIDGFRVVDRLGDRAMVEVTLHEGRKHIVRRLLAEVGHPVSRLARIQVGPIALGTLKAGTMRALTSKEVSDLYSAVGL
ncbi:MAG: pseudouridine synthase [Streptosporangiales bacterium]|nr:pseudouridine synthase [Streptosporangiales bacterium]